MVRRPAHLQRRYRRYHRYHHYCRHRRHRRHHQQHHKRHHRQRHQLHQVAPPTLFSTRAASDPPPQPNPASQKKAWKKHKRGCKSVLLARLASEVLFGESTRRLILHYSAVSDLLGMRATVPALKAICSQPAVLFCHPSLRPNVRQDLRISKQRYDGWFTSGYGDDFRHGALSTRCSAHGMRTFIVVSEEQVRRFDAHARVFGKTWTALSLDFADLRTPRAAAEADHGTERVVRCIRIVAECW